jgi:alpha-1,2-mannosyltransferase
LPYTYPPIAAAVFVPLSAVSERAAETIWWIASCSALIATFYIILRTSFDLSYRRALAVAFLWAAVACLAFEPVRSDMDYGQIEALLLLLVTWDYLKAPARFRGVLIGVAAAIKLTPLIFVVLLLIERDFRAVVRSIVSFVAASLVGLLILPSASLTYWTKELFDPEHAGNVSAVMNQSLDALMKRSGVHGSVLWITFSLVTILTACLLVTRLLPQGRRVESLLVMALAGCLVSPISWAHHWLWVAALPVPLVIQIRSREWFPAVLTSGVMLLCSSELYFRDWPPLLHPVEQNALVLMGIVFLMGWACYEVLAERHRFELKWFGSSGESYLG